MTCIMRVRFITTIVDGSVGSSSHPVSFITYLLVLLSSSVARTPRSLGLARCERMVSRFCGKDSEEVESKYLQQE